MVYQAIGLQDLEGHIGSWFACYSDLKKNVATFEAVWIYVTHILLNSIWRILVLPESFE